MVEVGAIGATDENWDPPWSVFPESTIKFIYTK